MLATVRKVLNILTFFFLVMGAIACGIWGFFGIEILNSLMGTKLSTIFYSISGLAGLYGVHLFVEYAKLQLEPNALRAESKYAVDNERADED